VQRAVGKDLRRVRVDISRWHSRPCVARVLRKSMSGMAWRYMRAGHNEPKAFNKQTTRAGTAQAAQTAGDMGEKDKTISRSKAV
jgi:hypothetical protein